MHVREQAGAKSKMDVFVVAYGLLVHLIAINLQLRGSTVDGRVI